MTAVRIYHFATTVHCLPTKLKEHTQDIWQNVTQTLLVVRLLSARHKIDAKKLWY